MKLTQSVIALVAVVSLAACGGSGGGDDPPVVDPDPTNPTDIVDPPGEDTNAPSADSLSFEVSSNPYVELQLIGTDPQGETLKYVLDTPATGDGYEQAFVDTDTGEFYVTILGGRESYEFLYRTTNGTSFSPQATITLTDSTDNLDQETGLGEPDIDVYGNIPLAYFDGDLFGSSPDDRTTPASIDLSGNFPRPGDQGRQNSCVAWAAGYALKSYQEKIEENWDFSAATLFSPAFIYNQTNGGQDRGSQIYDALDLIVNKGAATLQSHAYDDQDFTGQPSSAANAEAANYKAADYQRLTGLTQIKSALANRQPVVLGIKVFENMYGLSGPNSVYNTITGNNDGPHGLHAVTAVGYDDNKFGGALKIINSWGTRWGDEGYFWITYSLFSDVVIQAYVLEDGTNTGDEVVVPEPPDPTTGPNLQITGWSAEYNPQAGGEGTWQWEVANTGDATGGLGADINLMLSRDTSIDNSDIFVVYEEIPFDLAPGDRAFRNEDNPRAFEFPETLEPGTYYMAVWVDDLSEIAETDETDNVVFGQNTVEFEPTNLPDLAIESWYAAWDTGTGDGILEYTVYNNGTSATTNADWDVNLFLSKSVDSIERGYFLFFEDATFILEPGQTVFRNENNRAEFNLFRSQLGNDVIPGKYFMGLWVDDLNQVEETNEINNFSFDNLGVLVAPNASSRKQEFQTAFNGKRIPEHALTKQVEIVEDQHGNLRMELPEKTQTSSKSVVTTPIFSKSSSSGDKAVFPVNNLFAMPAANGRLGYDK